jgi:hypothetical protein
VDLIIACRGGAPQVPALDHCAGRMNEKYLTDTHFIGPPAHIWVLSHDQIETIR